MPPSPGASGREALQGFWEGAGLESIETKVFAVERIFEDFETYWTIVQGSPSASLIFSAMDPAAFADLKERVRRRIQTDAVGRVVCKARANAIQGRVPS
jgi:hypothetical protein